MVGMKHLWVSTQAHLAKILSAFNEPKEGDVAAVLELNLRILGHYSNWEELLWNILSHPSSNIMGVELGVDGPYPDDVDAWAKIRAVALLSKWCREVPVRGPRKILLNLGDGDILIYRAALTHLRQALTFPNNGITELALDYFSGDLDFVNLFLRPVLENPCNQLQALRIHEYCELYEADLTALSLAIGSEFCKLSDVQISLREIIRPGTVRILDSLLSRNLQQLTFVEADDSSPDGWTKEHRRLLTARLGYWLERPGNHLRVLTWTLLTFNQDCATTLATALMSDQCLLEELDCDIPETSNNATVPLIVALRHPNCRLTRLKCNFRGHETAAVLEESLRHPSCKLESLIFGDDYLSDDTVAICIARALKSTVSSRLRTLVLPQRFNGLSADVLFNFTESLLSPCNKLIHLNLHVGMRIGKATVTEFRRALLHSNITRFESDDQMHAFCNAFNEPFLKVLYTLLSVRLVPRLCSLSWARLLPFADFILRIADCGNTRMAFG